MIYAIVILINIIFFILLGLGIFLGWKRGLKYGAVHCGFVVMSIIFAFVISAPISKAILRIPVATENGQGVTLMQNLARFLSGAMQSSATLDSGITGIAAVIVFALVVIVVSLLCYIVFEIGYQLLKKFYLKKQQCFKNNEKTRNYGMIFGFFEMFVFTAFLFMPLTSLFGAAGSLLNQDKNSSVGSFVNANVPATIVEACNVYNVSPMAKIVTLWGLDDCIYDGFASIGTNISYKNDVLGTINNLSDGINNFGENDFAGLKENLNNIFDLPYLKNNLNRVVSEFIANKEKFVTSFGDGYDLQEALAQTLDNFDAKLRDANYFVADVTKASLSNIVDGLQIVMENDVLSKVAESSASANYGPLMTSQFLQTVADAIAEIVKMPIADEVFPVVKYVLTTIPALLKNYLDLDCLTSADVARQEINLACQSIVELAKIDEQEHSTLLPALMLGKGDFYQELINASGAEHRFEALASSKCLSRLILSTFHTLDRAVSKQIKGINSDIYIKDSDFAFSISYFETVENKNAFIDLFASQVDDFVTVAQCVKTNSEEPDFLITLTDMLQGQMAKHYQNGSVDSVYKNMFSNLIRFFSGEIKQKTGEPAFEQCDEFNRRVEEAFAKLSEYAYPVQDKYYFLSYSEILQGLY